jgi:hypothetical protein
MIRHQGTLIDDRNQPETDLTTVEGKGKGQRASDQSQNAKGHWILYSINKCLAYFFLLGRFLTLYNLLSGTVQTLVFSHFNIRVC